MQTDNYPFDLGAHNWAVDTNSPQAQIWCDRGMAWIYGFNHEEAVICFQEALKCDPKCAMAQWGIAYSIGPNYNRWWITFTPSEKTQMLEMAHGALEAATPQTLAEMALIEALKTRYPHDPELEDFQPFHDAYANAMRAVHARFSDDLTIKALYIEALMNRTPWAMWELETSAPNPDADTQEAQDALERAFEDPAAWAHPGLLHLYIHLMEMSPTPELALPHGDALGPLIPDAGHLWHMPTHIDVLCGRYPLVITRNQAGIEADEKYRRHRGDNNFYSTYRVHNYHFKAYGAMFAGHKGDALWAATAMNETIPKELLIKHGDIVESYISIRLHMMIRFGLWDDIIAEPLPGDPELYPYTIAIHHYARAIALANLKRDAEARAAADDFDAARTRVPEKWYVVHNKAEVVLAVAEAMMWGEILYHAGDIEGGFERLREGVRLDDGLYYQEPWAWMQPVRHALGALLMEQGETEEATAIYRADLGLDDTLPRANQHPGNIWALAGLHECYQKSAHPDLDQIAKQLEAAQAHCDIPVNRSCFCRST